MNRVKYLMIVDFDQLTELPHLPPALKCLDCSRNKLTRLPPLPSTLTELYCWKNQLTKLPALPSTLKILDCDYNVLKKLPTLPSTMVRLWCTGNNRYVNDCPSMCNYKFIYLSMSFYILHGFNSKMDTLSTRSTLTVY